jgi:hypothetical protein
MARISSSFSTGNWKTRTTTKMSLGMGTTPPREEEDDESTEEDPTVGSFLRVRSSDEDDGGDSDDGADSDDGSSSDDGAGDDGSDGGSDDGDVGKSPPIKCHRFLGTYWW